MKGKWTAFGSILLVILLALAVGWAQAQEPQPPGDVTIQAALGTAFTYQGQLKQSGNPVNGNCDFQFSLWDAASGGAQVGTTQTKTNVAVSNGLFTVQLDFGSVFTGDARWLAIAVRCPAGSGRYTNLSPRQALTATPYALGLRPGAFIQGSVGLGGVVSADNTSTGLLGSGLWGTSAGGIGVYGKTTATSGTTSGVWGESVSPEGRGVSGYANATSGAAYGVYGESESPAGAGVYGKSDTGDGVRAQSSGANKSGVYGFNDVGNGFGVYGHNTATGNVGYLGGAYGVYGQSNNPAGAGVVGWATTTSGFTYGVYGESASTNGYGVYGRATAASGYTYGVYGWSASTSGNGVYGQAPDSGGGSGPGYAGYFNGDVRVSGTLSKAAGGFRIDHPLDPANKYLNHSFVESPDMKNIYDGVIMLDSNGEATVSLPNYFSALNQDFRYQLTAIGAPMPNLYIAQEIQGNTFKIAGGVPGKKVSWQVTGIRHDPFAEQNRIPVEEDKSADEQGTYLYPVGYGQPEEMGLDYQHNRHLLERAEIAARPAGDGE